MKLVSLVFALVFGAGALGLAAAPAQAGAILNVVDGKLVGARDVNILGTLYDVSFQDGSCATLYSGCDQNSDFYFNTYSNARAAAQALLDQVLTDSIEGQFDSIAGLTGGCSPSTTSSHCIIKFPYVMSGANQFIGFTAFNYNASGDYTSHFYGIPGQTSNGAVNVTWALFLPDGSLDEVVAVPEPSTLALFGAGLLGLAGIARRRRQA